MSASWNMTRRAFVASSMVTLLGCAQTDDAKETDGSLTTEGDLPTEDLANDEASTGEDANSSAGEGSKTLVIYYSRADENYAGGGTEWLEVGHTKVMAGYIAEELGADEYEIVPAEAYPEGYDDCCDVALEEQKDDARPAIAGDLPDLSSYDSVFVGCPIWWGEEPMVVRTFLESVDLAGKTVIPFTTHGGSGLGSVPQNLQRLAPKATHLDGLAIAGTSVDSSRNEIVAWAKGLGL